MPDRCVTCGVSLKGRASIAIGGRAFCVTCGPPEIATWRAARAEAAADLSLEAAAAGGGVYAAAGDKAAARRVFAEGARMVERWADTGARRRRGDARRPGDHGGMR